MDLTSLLAGWAIAQAEATAPEWVSYLVYAGIGLVLLLVVVKALRRGPPPERTLDAPDAPQVEHETRSDADIKADAAAAFDVLQVERSDSADLRVKILNQADAPAPTGAEVQAVLDAKAAAEAAKRGAELARRAAEDAARKATDDAGRQAAKVAQDEAERARLEAKDAAEAAAAERRRAEEERKRVAAEKKAADAARKREEAEKKRAAEDEKKQAALAREAEEAAKIEAAEAAKRAAAEAAGATLREGLARTNEGFAKKLGKLFGNAKTLDDDLLAELEEALFTADIGVKTAQALVESVYDDMSKRALKDPAKVWKALRERIAAILDKDFPPLDLETHTPTVIMVVGVNGAGKTTSIGKLAKRYADEGKKVMLAAGDTFRAAAVEQLEVWGERAGVPVVKGESQQDPSSVLFDAAKQAKEGGYDLLIADTAGRLQARKELMEELAKIHRVMGKALPGAPHEVWLVLDATNGQNAISQAKIFTEMVEVTGIVLTKLDGTAKGGVVIGISDEMNLPVRFIGIGEKVGDLRPFEAGEFVEALFADA
ncbi:MAG: fused signal recognition particle receptor [Bradymonadia bacterium]|jgi:fused signal recognition particle receptor